MGENERNKLNRLEELKDQLFNKSYQTKIEHRDNYSRPHMSDIVDSWETKEKPASANTEQFFMQTSKFKKFFIFSIVFFVLTLLYGGYVFFGGGNTVSNDNIDISVLGNNFTSGGDELPLVVGITNKNAASLDLVDLIVEYPKGSDTDATSDTERFRESLGTILPGAVHNENLKVTLFGQEGSVRTIKISLEYRVAGSSAIFVKEKDYNVNISSTPINLSVDAPTTTSTNQSITLNVSETLNATKPSPKTLLKVIYPVGFQFTSSVPAPSFGNNVWNLGDLPPGATRNISITGKLVDVFDGEEKTFNIFSGSQSSTDKSAIGVVFNSIFHTVTVSKAFVEANLFINGVSQTDYAIDAKTSVTAEIRYVNNLDTKINDLVIQAKISGNAFNRQTISVQDGFYDSAKDTITWEKSSSRQLKELNPGDSGSVVFSVSPLSLFSAAGGILTNPSINIAVDISGKQPLEGSVVNQINNSTSTVVRIISDIGFATKALYYSGAFTNSGPIPPKVGEKTTYTIVWTLSNTANSISNAQIISSLPPWINFVGPVSPTGENLIYNSSTKQITWNVDRIAKGAGVIGAARTVSFQVSFIPSLSQVGKNPTIINSSVLTGHDDFAKVDMKVNKTALTTKLSDDPAFLPSGGNVVE